MLNTTPWLLSCDHLWPPLIPHSLNFPCGVHTHHSVVKYSEHLFYRMFIDLDMYKPDTGLWTSRDLVLPSLWISLMGICTGRANLSLIDHYGLQARVGMILTPEKVL